MEEEKGSRRKFTLEEKVEILRRHLVKKVPISDLCDEYQVKPSVIYYWQSQVMQNLGLALASKGSGRRKEERREAALRRRIEELEARLAKKDEVIAEVSAEYVALKKELGEL